jgi:hypothetical protein
MLWGSAAKSAQLNNEGGHQPWDSTFVCLQYWMWPLQTFPKFHVCISGVRKRNVWKNNLLARVEWARASLWVDKIAHRQHKGPSPGVSAGFPQCSNLHSRSLLRLCTVDTTKTSSLTPKEKRCRALRDPPVLHRHNAPVLGYFAFQACEKQSLSPGTQQEPASRNAP